MNLFQNVKYGINDILIGSVAKRNICGTERKGEKCENLSHRQK